MRIGDTSRGAKDAKELIALTAYAAKEAELLENHGPRNDRKQKKKGQNAARHQTRVLKNAAQVNQKNCCEQKNDVIPSVAVKKIPTSEP